MLKIKTKIDALEIDGKEVSGLREDANQLIIKAHWNINRFVVLEFQGKCLTVSGLQLQKAIQNAMNYD